MLEILSTILDYLDIQCLLRFARVSKRMQEMVYDDTRWVQRLRLMDCWDEQEARMRADGARKKRAETLRSFQQKESSRAINGVNGTARESSLRDGSRKPSITIFDASTAPGAQDATKVHNIHSAAGSELGNLDDGFDAIDVAPGSPEEAGFILKPHHSAFRLQVFKHLRSSRGYARQEYGKVHGALAPFYWDAIGCQNKTQAVVFRTYRDPDQQAQMLSNLVRFSRSDLSRGWRQRNEDLNALVGAFETAVSREFEQALDTDDVTGKMRKYAHVLASLNGGSTAVEMFISRNPILESKHKLGDPLETLNDRSSGNFLSHESFAFFGNLSSAFNEQITIIDQVFPPNVDVIVPFTKRTGELIICEYLTTIFDEAYRTNAECYLKAVSATCDQCFTYAKSLQPTPATGDEFYESVDEVIANAFAPHLDRYLTEELSFFKKKSDAEVGEWEQQLSEQDASMQSMFMSNVNRQADKRDFLTSFKKVVMMPVNVLPTFPMSSPFGGKPAVAKALVNGETLATSEINGSRPSTRPSSPGVVNGTSLSIKRPTTPLSEPPTTELAAKAAIMNSRLEGIRSLFSIEVALNLVHNAKSSIERAVVFVRLGGRFDKDARLQCELIFISLLETLGTRHIKTGFDQAIDHLSKYNPRESSAHNQSGVTPLVTFLELVNVGDLIQQMLDVFYEQELVATKLTDRNDFLNPAVKEKKRFEQMLDSRVAAGLNKGIEVLMGEVEYVCATTQKSDDYNPGASSNVRFDTMDIGPSQTALQIVDIVSSHTKMLVGSTDKNMLDVFNQEVGMRLFTALCKHIKRQRISVNGSIKLIRSVALHSFSPPHLISRPIYQGRLTFVVQRHQSILRLCSIAEEQRSAPIFHRPA